MAVSNNWGSVAKRSSSWGSVVVLVTGVLTAQSALAQEEGPPPANPDAPLSGSWKLRLDAPIVFTRSTDGEAAGQKVEATATSFGLPAAGTNLQLGYAVTPSANLGLQLGWVQSESTVKIDGAQGSSVTVKSSQYRVGIYGEHLFLSSGSVHPSLGVVGEVIGGNSGQDSSGVGVGANGGVQVFIGSHASLDFNVRGEWLSLSVGETKTSGFEFAGGIGVALWFGGSEPAHSTDAEASERDTQLGSTEAESTATSDVAAAEASDSSSTAAVQFSGATTLTVKGDPAAPTFQLLVRNPEGECADVRVVVGEQEQTIDGAASEKVSLGSSDAVVYRGEIPADLVRRMANAQAETPVRIRACGRDDMAGFFNREPLRDFLR